MWLVLLDTSLFVPMGKPPGHRRGGGCGPMITPPLITAAPGPSMDGVAHVTQPPSQRELCALCPSPTSPTHCSAPGWRRNREPDVSKAGERTGPCGPLTWGKSNEDSSPDLGCKWLVPAPRMDGKARQTGGRRPRRSTPVCWRPYLELQEQTGPSWLPVGRS